MRRHRCKGCRKRGTFDELVDHVREDHPGFVEIEMPYRVSYPHETEQLELSRYVQQN